MPSYMIRGLPAGLIARAKARARASGAALDDVLVRFLESYAEGKTSEAYGAKGGQARAAALTPERRADIARRAAEARWSEDDPSSE